MKGPLASEQTKGEVSNRNLNFHVNKGGFMLRLSETHGYNKAEEKLLSW